MKNLQISLLLGDKKILSSDYLHIQKLGIDRFIIRIDNAKVTEPILLKEGITLELNIAYAAVYQKNNSGFDFTLLNDLTLTPGKSVVLLSDYGGGIYYSQYKIDILHAWENDLGIHWSYLSAELQKGWLLACLNYTGLPKQLKTEENYIIDGSLVKSYNSFYCMLGETFFGCRGYFGQDLDGFDDCMIELGNHGQTLEGCRITIKAFDKIRKVLNRYYPDYINLFLEVLDRYKFVVEIL